MGNNITCSAVVESTGQPCGAAAMENGFCFMHSPEHKDAARLARLKGGINRRSVPIGDFPGRLESVTQLVDWINATICEAWHLESGERRISAITALLRVAVDVLSLSDVSARLEILEGLVYASSQNNRKAN